MTRTCSFWTVSPRLPDDLRRRSSARDHAGPVSHNHKKRTRGALTASLFVVPAPGPTVPGFLFYLPHLLTLLGVVPAYIRRKQHPIRQHHPMRAGTLSRRLIAAFACAGTPGQACRRRHRQVAVCRLRHRHRLLRATARAPPPANPATHPLDKFGTWDARRQPTTISRPSTSVSSRGSGWTPGRKIHDRVPNGCASVGRRRHRAPFGVLCDPNTTQ